MGFLVSSAIGGLLAVAGVASWTRSYKWALVALILWFLLCGLFFGQIAKRRLLRLNGLLNDCKIEEYVEAYDKVENHVHGKEGHRMAKMNKAKGLIALGAVDEALLDLAEVDIPEKHRMREMNLIAILNIIYFNACMEKGDLDKALKALAVCKYMTNDSMYREPFKSNMVELCKRADARIDLFNGEFDGLEERYWEILRNSSTMLDKVTHHYRLAEIAEHFGNEEDRQEHLEFVVENGGTTIYRYYAQLALKGEKIPDQAIYNAPVDDSGK